MNRKGFTLIELLTSIILSSAVLILLLQILLVLKDLYVNDSVKTELLIKKSNIVKRINSTFNESPISTIRNCDDNTENCLNFTLSSGSEYELSVDRNNNIISFGSFTTELSNSSTIYEDLDVCYFYNTGAAVSETSSYDTGIRIKIPIKDNLLEENFDIIIIYQYDGSDYPYLYSDDSSGSLVTYINSCDVSSVN